nr:MAG TPA: hypothetical protein [Bacteriophage sp.]
MMDIKLLTFTIMVTITIYQDRGHLHQIKHLVIHSQLQAGGL